MINWRSIEVDGYPTNDNKSYIVSDGKEISTTNIRGRWHYKGDGNPTFTFIDWSGDENTYEDNQCCSGTPMFDLKVTHWCPTDELNLP